MAGFFGKQSRLIIRLLIETEIFFGKKKVSIANFFNNI